MSILFIFLGLFGFQKEVYADVDQLDNTILLAMLYISHNTTPEGKFVYRNSTDVKKKYSDEVYSSLRHAGTLYSMYLCERDFNNLVLQNKRYLASEYLIKNYVKRVDADKYAVVSKPIEEAPVLLATSGGTGLGLIALSNLVSENKFSIETLKKMGNFLIYMQNEEGDYAPSYEFGKKEKSGIYSARYYPGEASLGLLYLYDVDNDFKWFEASKKGLLRLAERADSVSLEKIKFDHWALLSIQKLFKTPNRNLTYDEISKLKKFAEKNVKSVLSKQIMDEADENYGAFTGTRTMCGMATIMEGLVAAYDIVDDKNLKVKITRSLKAVSEYFAKYQVKSGEMEGGIPATSIWNTPQAEPSDKEIRIDNVQHTLSGLVTYKKLLSK